MRTLCANDPWDQTVSLISKMGNISEKCERSRTPQDISGWSPQRRSKPVVTLIDRASSTTLTVYWRDSTCHYGDQQWRRGRARQCGNCAVTGEPIQVGDDVYRPSARQSTPMNSHEMLLASTVMAGVDRYGNCLTASSFHNKS